ncbi:hypothetical protein [Portibacter marinus]|uniref:hypothetical protein n=1 Tax=Portibacter marinus TaxID=2898660 RepID=UPI001F194E73|nr:hypothetical protein [Portibacter marinus]
MKKIAFLILILNLSWVSNDSYATNPISQETFVEIEKSKDKTGLLSKIKSSFKKAIDKVKIRQLAWIALIAGVLSLVGLILLSLGSAFLIAAAILAILADIFAIIVLRKTGKDRQTYKLSRRMAIWGLVTGLLTGLIPLLLLLLVIIAFGF